MLKYIKLIVVVMITLLFIFPVSGVPGNSKDSPKRSLTHDDYDSWKSITDRGISADGKWIFYIETPQDGDAKLVVKDLHKGRLFRYKIGYSGEKTDAEKAAKPKFSYDSSHIIFLISPSKTEVKKAKKDKKGKKKDKLHKKLGIMDLSKGDVAVVEHVKSFELPKEAGGWVAYLKEKPKKKKEKEGEGKKGEKKGEEKKEKKDKKKKYGTQLALYSLKDGNKTVFKSVLNYRFTKDGKNLLYIVSSKEKPEIDGIYCYEPSNSSGKELLTGKGTYKRWGMNKFETVMAFLTDRDDQSVDKPTFSLYGWSVGDLKASLWVSHRSTRQFPKGMAVSDKSDVSFSEDGSVVMFGIKEIPEPESKDNKNGEEDEAKFDLWHWNDPYPQPQQKKIAKKIRNNTWESVYFIRSKKFVKLADKNIPDVQLSRDGKVAFAQTILPYTKKVSYEGRYYDIYVIDPKKSKRTQVKKELFRGARLSPDGKYVYWFQDKDWYIFNIKNKTIKNITSLLDVDFTRYDWDTPNPPRNYGVAGWIDGDASILIYDRYDIWEVKPNGSNARRITEGWGRKNNISFRYIKLDPEEVTIKPQKTLLLRATNQETMATGYFQDRVKGNDLPKKLILADKNFSYPIKAKKSNLLLYTRSTFDEYPDLWVSDLNLKNQKKITNLGKQMEPFLWGKAEMRSFLSSDGKSLKGILIKPENFTPSKKYPLMVYIYETLHKYLRHRFRHPSPGTSINLPYYISNGYVIWMPDIEYDTGYPGKDALKCVLPGIQMLVREGFINPKAIGIQGHSWGGYQIAYMVTQTNIFAAAEAGAPVSNMISAYGGIRWRSGMVRQFQYERTQSRLGGSLWKVPLRYIENSPIFWADQVQTPLMMIHNDKDGAVPWYQGIEFMMALRRLGKEAYMFNYIGEAHGLRKRVNRKDWTKRMAEFFDHYLKGYPIPDWMKKGIKAWEKKEKKEKESK